MSFFDLGDQFYSQREHVHWYYGAFLPAVDAPVERLSETLHLLHRFGVTHLLFDRRRLFAELARKTALADPAVMARSYELCYEDTNTVLYGLRCHHHLFGRFEHSSLHAQA